VKNWRCEWGGEDASARPLARWLLTGIVIIDDAGFVDVGVLCGRWQLLAVQQLAAAACSSRVGSAAQRSRQRGAEAAALTQSAAAAAADLAMHHGSTAAVVIVTRDRAAVHTSESTTDEGESWTAAFTVCHYQRLFVSRALVTRAC